MANSITYLASDLEAQVRLESDLNLSQVFDPDQLVTVISDAGSSLRDIFTGANQLYDIKTFDFTLTGGIGANSVVLPQDFQQGHSIDVNPDTAQPFTLRYLPNWLNRNSYSLPFQIFGNNFGPKAYTFLGNEIMVFPAQYAAGSYRLYYTPTWTPLAIPISVDVETASIAITCDGSVTGFGPGQNFFGFGNPFLPTDVGCSVVISGASNSDNNGSFTVTGYISSGQITLSGSHTTETFATSATVTLLRNSRVVASSGVWTLYGDNPNTNATLANVKAGDTFTVTGTASNNGTFTITAVGANTLTTATAGLVDENFATAPTITVQPEGTRPDLPQNMNPWIQYIKTQACITVRNKRGQPVDTFEARLAVEKDRIQVILQDRKEEPTQPPLLRGTGGFGGIGDGGGWGTW